MKEHGECVLDIGVISDSDFKSFKRVIKEIIMEGFIVDESNLINPTKKFSTGELYILDSTLQQTAIALIALKEGTINEIAQESGLTIEVTSTHIHQLQEKGLIGEKFFEEEIKYFCSI